MYDKIRKTTIQDVAKQTGVGIATVPRTLNNSEGISEKTKTRSGLPGHFDDIAVNMKPIRNTKSSWEAFADPRGHWKTPRWKIR
ncbi:hypothetical protein J22TS3_16570 [Paenibacillus sp. J22TS3]|nr:hypothetical protein J22TS3_16570 [Paenibacillus sp. J22TS3]